MPVKKLIIFSLALQLLMQNVSGRNGMRGDLKYFTSDTVTQIVTAINSCIPTASTTNISICLAQLPYFWNGNSYSTAGTYTKTLTNVAGCDSIATLNLIVNAVVSSTSRVNICPSQLPYNWNGNSYNAEGTYNVALKGFAGCDSIATIVLTVYANSKSITNISVCPSALPYVWNGILYNTTGTYIKKLTNAVGCDSIATLNLNVKAATSSVFNASVCPAQLPYTWNGLLYNTTGTYTKNFINAAGCDSVATLNLTVMPVITSTTNISVCPSALPYVWNGSSYSISGTYTKNLTNAAGCDSIATLNLSVVPTLESTTNTSVCTNQLPYLWNGNSFNTSGTYTKSLINAAGCDSVATLVLTVKATTGSTTNVSVCPSALPYIWNGIFYSTSGTYTKTLPNAAGCDSVAKLILTVKANTASTININVCPSALPFIWNGISYNTSGTYTKTFINAAGCDSIAKLNLVVNSVVNSTTNIIVCASSLPYSWNGNSYSKAGSYSKVLANSAGCDSIAILNLGVIPTATSTSNINICPPQLPYTWNGTVYNAAGTYTKTLVSAKGCDSIATLNLTVTTTVTSTNNISVCPSALPYIWNGNSYNTGGTYTSMLVNAAGCDSIATLNLSVIPILTSTTSVSVCSNKLPYVWNDNLYSVPGIYTKTLTTAAGCDSIATLNLSINAVSNSTANVSICPAQLPYIWNGTFCNTPGIYAKSFTNAAGCDSIAVLILTVNANTTSITSMIVCSSALPYVWNGDSYDTSGTYTKILANTAGCDSIATLNLMVNDFVSSTTNTSICRAQLPYSWNGNSYNTGGTYTKTFISATGCDSIAMLNLTVNAVVSGSENVSICPSQLPYAWNGNLYNTPGTYNVALKGFAGCDSIATIVLTLNKNSTSTTNISVCPSALPYIWNGNVYSSTGTYTKVFTNAIGCDSAATLNLAVKPVTNSTSNITVCPAKLPYSWNGFSYNTPGSYTKRFINTAGCDSVATLNLAVSPIVKSITDISVCPSALPYTWNGNFYNASGTYTKTFTNTAGCDSVATLDLKVNAVVKSTTSISVCASALPYTWNDNSYNTSGTYTKTLINTAGCDSIATLILLIISNTTSTTNVSVCASALPYTWNGSSYNSAGTYTKKFLNNTGCDSIATLNLLISPTLTSTTNKSVCANQLPFLWNGISCNDAGTFTVVLTSASGCDSAATLVLSVDAPEATPSLGNDTALCPGETIVLSPGTFHTYLWQDLSTFPEYKVTQPGSYSVTVSNSDGCSGNAKIAITLLSNCNQIYFPNAITPNGDGVNDNFGALGYVRMVSKYSLSIYNRFGELVFSTTNPYQKWNALYKGNPVDNSTFVWHSDYIINGKRKVQKGYFIVIR